MHHATILVAILAFVPLTSATAQVPVRPGARVRVTGRFCQPVYSNCVLGRTESRVGTFVGWKSDSLVMKSKGDILAAPQDFVTRVEVSLSRKSKAGRGAKIGALVLGIPSVITGVIVGLAIEEICLGLSCNRLDLDDRVMIAVGLGVIGAGTGALFGAVIGSVIRPDHWGKVPLDRLRLQVAPQRDGRFGFGASVRF